MTLLDTLTSEGRIWTARHWQETVIPATPSHYPELDEHLPGHGWPLGAVTEIFYPRLGFGELRLLLPALADLSQLDNRWQLWLNPPLIPCAPALQQWGINTQRILIATATSPSDICYSLEKSLQSAGCQAAVAWLEKLDNALMRRIQLAAEATKIPIFIFKPIRYQKQPSIAALRLTINTPGHINILKRRAGWPINDIQLSLPLHRN